MLNLQQFLEHIEIRGLGQMSALSAINIDDVFNALNKIGVEEVEINTKQMNSILYFMFTNSRSDWKTEIKEGKTDKYMGIKLFLE